MRTVIVYVSLDTDQMVLTEYQIMLIEMSGFHKQTSAVRKISREFQELSNHS